MSKSKHDKHSHCDHEVKYCNKCNTTYCEKCSKEWTEEPCNQNHYPYTWYIDKPSITTTTDNNWISKQDISSVQIYSGKCAHS